MKAKLLFYDKWGGREGKEGRGERQREGKRDQSVLYSLKQDVFLLFKS
jgi:hypothetical protein